MAERKAKTPAKMGRPSKYTDNTAKQALKLSRLGATDKEMADFFEVSLSTLSNWKVEHDEFMDALKQGKMLADAEVSHKLFKRATGYQHPEDDIRVVNGMLTITPTIKRYPPDTTAAIFWLKNRRPDKWRDRPEGGDDETPVAPVKVEISVKDARKIDDKEDPDKPG